MKTDKSLDEFCCKGSKEMEQWGKKDQVKSFLKIEEIIVCLPDGNHPATTWGGESWRELLKLWL